MSGHNDRDAQAVSFRETLHLPRTDMPMRADAHVNDPRMIERWEQEQVYERAMESNTGNQSYILHDGPPYANGHIHLGHAYNKILKDILTKSYRMSGYHTPVRPGWDCHGLPIELKVSQEHPKASAQELKKACRAYARSWIDVQRREFKNLGVMMDWEKPYLTMDFDYESRTVEAFGKLVAQGFIERKNKTVAWCFSCQTVLASAEIEYKDRKDPSLYVLFEIDRTSPHALSDIAELVFGAIWTTTPWTLPLNRAVLAKRGGNYELIRVAGKLIVVGSERVAAMSDLLGQGVERVKTLRAQDLEGIQFKHPFEDGRFVPLVLDDSVGETEGTGLVHCAPGCGPLDYEVGVKNGLEIFAPVAADGKYTAGVMPRELEQMSVLDGQIWVIKNLAARSMILYKGSLQHSYPHCWRCRNGLIFRATRQWFFNLEHEGVKERALAAVASMRFYPEAGRNFLRATIENRWEWCLSRQRVWGSPIPAMLCATCDHAYVSPEFVYKIAEGIAKEGVEYWERVTFDELFPQGLVCSQCGGGNFTKEKDILDVWFDAGVSHYAVLAQDERLRVPADMYLEGVDQHRGWFQSSLLTAIALTGATCTTGIMTHGFTVDAQGQKMSKSLGNGVEPQDVIKKIGTDGLRLWVASVGHDGDAVMSDVLVANVSEVFRKIRNTCRGLLMNLYDFNHTQDLVALDDLQELDRIMLHELARLNIECIQRYHAGDFAAVVRKITDFCAVDLSALYLDVVKDRLYCEKADGRARRSAQTVLWYACDALTRLIAPIMSFTAESVSDYLYSNKQRSIHMEHFALVPDPYALEGSLLGAYEKELSPTVVGHIFEAARHMQEVDAVREQEQNWEVLRALRAAVLKAIEPLRAQGVIKQSMEAAIEISVSPDAPYYGLYQEFLERLAVRGQTIEAFLKELCVVSRVTVVSASDDLQRTALEGFMVGVAHAPGVKCPRCWQWDESARADQLCRRCESVLA